MNRDSFSKVADSLYFAEFPAIDFVRAETVARKRFNPPSPMSCTVVRKGDFVGRNCDWYINDSEVLVSRVKSSPGSYGFLALTGFGFRQKDMEERGIEAIDSLAAYMIDGCNEMGLVVCSNAAATGLTSRNTSLWCPRRWGLGAAYSRKGGEKMCSALLVSLILAKAASVEEALNIVGKYSWYDPVSYLTKDKPCSFQWMLADEHRCAVLEFIDNKMEVSETTLLNAPSYATIMTNFSNKLRSEGILQNPAQGYERFDQVFRRYPLIPATEAGMKELLYGVRFSLKYRKTIDDPDFFATDYVFSPTSEGRTFSTEQLYTRSVCSDPDFERVVNKAKADFSKRDLWFTPDYRESHTAYTSVYSIPLRSLVVRLFEGEEGQVWHVFHL